MCIHGYLCSGVGRIRNAIVQHLLSKNQRPVTLIPLPHLLNQHPFERFLYILSPFGKGTAITERAASAMMLASMAESRSRSNKVQSRVKKCIFLDVIEIFLYFCTIIDIELMSNKEPGYVYI